jgi:ATPase subunit of ABC transporter with duplicated ATPase domains
LDRDALGGLAVAIRDWAGAVVIISHNEEFVGALCKGLILSLRSPEPTLHRPRNMEYRGGEDDPQRQSGGCR